MRAVSTASGLTLLGFLYWAAQLDVSSAEPAFCPVSEITSCKNKLEKCTRELWHGIDSLEVYELLPINSTAVSIRSLNTAPSFDDTVGIVSTLSKETRLPADPKFCIKAPPLPTGEGNCTTRMTAFFSDANATLETMAMESCGILSWKGSKGAVGHLYGQWVHANEPTPSPPGAMCDWEPNNNLYREVGTGGPDARYFTLSNVDLGEASNQTAVHIHSLNGSFPDTVATVHEVGAGTPGKIAWRAELFGGQLYRGIMRANSAGGPACCQVSTNTKTGARKIKNCPVVSWWAADGSSSCWEPINVPAEPIGACGE